MSCFAFVPSALTPSTSSTGSSLLRPTKITNPLAPGFLVASRRQRGCVLRMSADAGDKKEEDVVEVKPLVSMPIEDMKMREEVLNLLKQEQAAPEGNRRNYGATRDADGKSNIWAVEPRIAVDNDEERKESTTLTIVGVISALLVAILLLKTIPLTNVEQL